MTAITLAELYGWPLIYVSAPVTALGGAGK